MVGQVATFGAHLLRPRLSLGVRLIAFDDAGRVFLVRHSYLPGLHLPGGAVDRGETPPRRSDPRGAARRAASTSRRAPRALQRLPSAHACGIDDHVIVFRARNAETDPDWRPSARDPARPAFTRPTPCPTRRRRRPAPASPRDWARPPRPPTTGESGDREHDLADMRRALHARVRLAPRPRAGRSGPSPGRCGPRRAAARPRARSAAAMRALASTDCGRSVEPVSVSRFIITWAKLSSAFGAAEVRDHHQPARRPPARARRGRGSRRPPCRGSRRPRARRSPRATASTKSVVAVVDRELGPERAAGAHFSSDPAVANTRAPRARGELDRGGADPR